MSLTAHIGDSLRAVSPASLSAYARLNGWAKADPYGAHSDVYTAAGLPDIVLPRTQRLADYANVVSEIVRIFAEVAGIEEREMLRELTVADRDAIKVRASCDDTVPVEHGIALIAGAKDMVAAAARSLYEPAAAYRGRPVNAVTDYLHRVQLAGMERGSFVVTLLPPAVPPAVGYSADVRGTRNESPEGLEGGPIERQATRRLADALAATRQAIEATTSGQGDAFADAISRGTSANLCQALAEMIEPFDALDLALTWALTRPPQDAKPATRFEFAKGDSYILREAARALRERRVQANVQLTATIEGLRRDGREVTLRTQWDGSPRFVVAQVTKADYEGAIDIHKKCAKAVLTGDLEHSGGRCRLLNPRIVG